MSGVELGFLAPHPWIMVAGEQEEGHHAMTTSGYRRVRNLIAEFIPDVMIVASPHWPPFPKRRIGGAARYAGTLDTFLPQINAGLPPGHRRDLPPVPYDFPGDGELAECLWEAGGLHGRYMLIGAMGPKPSPRSSATRESSASDRPSCRSSGRSLWPRKNRAASAAAPAAISRTLFRAAEPGKFRPWRGPHCPRPLRR